jgi:hypothetical protein
MNKKISQLPLATGVTGANLVPIVAGGVTQRATLSTLATFMQANGPTGPTGVAGGAGVAVTGFTAIAVVTQAAYDALSPPNPNTLYIVTS